MEAHQPQQDVEVAEVAAVAASFNDEDARYDSAEEDDTDTVAQLLPALDAVGVSNSFGERPALRVAWGWCDKHELREDRGSAGTPLVLWSDGSVAFEWPATLLLRTMAGLGLLDLQLPNWVPTASWLVVETH